jgi:hypothetical protein
MWKCVRSMYPTFILYFLVKYLFTVVPSNIIQFFCLAFEILTEVGVGDTDQ